LNSNYRSWGFEPTINHFGPGHQVAYYLKMARERGTPVICIEPRYTVAAEVIADQWIPIKPGTDAAMMLAMGYLLFKKDLYDKKYVEKYVDARGVEEWKSYLLGEKDGVPKTPEWAEKICGVPAETISAFTDLYAQTKPTWLWLGWGPPRKSRGENVVRAACALQAITGNWGVAGGSVPIDLGTRPKPARMLPYGEIPKVRVPKMYRSHQWAQMVLLKEKVDSGEMSPEEYKKVIGWRAPNDLPLPTPKILLGGGTWLHNTRTVINAADSTNDHIKAADKMDMVVWMHSHMSPSLWISDVILPCNDQSLEDRRIWGGGTPGYGGFVNMTYVPGVVEPPGEARPAHWIYTELARGSASAKSTILTARKAATGGRVEKYLRNELIEWRRNCWPREKMPEWKSSRSGLYNVQETNRRHSMLPSFIDKGTPLRRRRKDRAHSYVIRR
jgi:anaerobic dimethyl sulfoxide reductase subunit A